MKKRQILSLAIIVGAGLTAHAAEKPATEVADKNAIPKGCVKLEGEIKFSGKDIYLSDGHLTAGKLSVSHLSSIDSKAAEVIRNDDIPGLEDSGSMLAKGEITLGTVALNESVSELTNDPLNPRSAIQLKVHQKDDSTADISGSIQLKPAQIALIKLRNMNPAKLDVPIAVCGLGMQLYVNLGKKKIDKGAVILYINNGSEKPFAMEALNDNRKDKATGEENLQFAQDSATRGPNSSASAL